MTDISSDFIPSKSPTALAGGQVHPPIVRICHWLNALAMIIMIGSGWRIYDDSPLLSWLYFWPEISLGGARDVGTARVQNWAFGGLQWHFAAMWLLVINGLVYVTYGIVSQRFRRMFFPISVGGVTKAIGEALSFKLDHQVGVYNHVQRLLYVGVIGLAVLIILSGLAIWKPVQFRPLAALFLTFQGARWVHFLCMTGIVLFLMVHVLLSLLVPQTIVSMVTGKSGHTDHDGPVAPPH